MHWARFRVGARRVTSQPRSSQNFVIARLGPASEPASTTFLRLTPLPPITWARKFTIQTFDCDPSPLQSLQLSFTIPKTFKHKSMSENQGASYAIFNTDSDTPPDLYGVLGLASSKASEAEIRTAYRRQALKFHPDKLAASLTSAQQIESRHKFDQVGLAYKILSDQKLRERYDQTGRIDENPFFDGLDDEASWTAYFKDLWSGEVNSQTIEEFTQKYRGSDEERNDLHDNYLQFNGSLPDILSHTMCATDDCEPRLIQRIDESIKAGTLPSMPNWDKTKKDQKARESRQKRAKKEAKEADELAKQLGVHDKLFNARSSSAQMGANGEPAHEASEEALKALIQSNAKQKHESLIAKLEAKALAENKKPSKNQKSTKVSKKQTKASERKDPSQNNEPEGTRELQPSEKEFYKQKAKLEARGKKYNLIQNQNESSSSAIPVKEGSSRAKRRKT
ncbi:hypothetical protein O181_027067 [Austropuccinia psidii MF-1]|uniref:J domain-containing protein n=1 Tax=Austropuccinia psidii MF-1 TaxID=1389203 RepID=A0A9Q3CRV8_9BASI|nr:hypothetical protein [Austropuccinia psidii MF-1]